MMYFNDPIPNCVPEFYRSMQEDADHLYERQARIREQNRERFRINQEKLAAAAESGLPILTFGGYGPCRTCPHADCDTMLDIDDDFDSVICHDPSCHLHRERQEEEIQSVGSHVYEWYVIENINDPGRRIDHVLPLDEAISLYSGLDCGDKRLGVTKDGIAAVDLAIRWNGREWLSEDRLKEDSFRNDPVVADACDRIQRMLETAPITGEENPK